MAGNTLLGQLRRIGRAPEAGFSIIEGPVDSASFDPLDSGPPEAEAEVVEGRTPRLRAIDVGAPEESAFTCFLDGIQRARVAAFRGPVPIVYAYAAAVIRGRRERRMSTFGGRLRTALSPLRLHDGGGVATIALPQPPQLSTRYQEEREALFFPFRLAEPSALTGSGIAETQMIDTGPESPGEPLPLFPPLLYTRAAEAINQWREGLERHLAERWCAANDEAGWLLVDGSLTLCGELARCPRAVGLIKSHRTRFFDGDDARVLLGLEQGQRTSVFQPKTRRFTPVYSWYLRLRSPAGKDVFWGLARIEVAATEEALERANEISRWLLSEAAPLALPDSRWDRLVYPIHDCEQYLRARAPQLH